MKKVLIVDDNVTLLQGVMAFLEGLVEIVPATTLQEAYQAFHDNPDADLIAVDACLEGKTPDTLNFTRQTRASFSGPLIAISSDPVFRKMQVEAGCDMECPKNKIHHEILKIFNLEEET